MLIVSLLSTSESKRMWYEPQSTSESTEERKEKRKKGSKWMWYVYLRRSPVWHIRELCSTLTQCTHNVPAGYMPLRPQWDNCGRQKDHVLHHLIRIGIHDWASFNIRGPEGIWSMTYTAVIGNRLFRLLEEESTKVHWQIWSFLFVARTKLANARDF